MFVCNMYLCVYACMCMHVCTIHTLFVHWHSDMLSKSHCYYHPTLFSLVLTKDTRLPFTIGMDYKQNINFQDGFLILSRNICPGERHFHPQWYKKGTTSTYGISKSKVLLLTTTGLNRWWTEHRNFMPKDKYLFYSIFLMVNCISTEKDKRKAEFW